MMPLRECFLVGLQKVFEAAAQTRQAIYAIGLLRLICRLEHTNRSTSLVLDVLSDYPHSETGIVK